MILVSTWSNGLFALVGPDCQEEWPGHAVSGLARDGQDNALAIVDGTSLCRRTAAGVWDTLAKSEFDLACCVAAGGDIYVGANATPQVMRVAGDGRLEAVGDFDRIAGRHQWYAGTALIDGRLLGPPLGIRSMAATCDGKVLFANVHVGGIPRSLDGGSSWQPTIEVDCDVHQVCAHPTRAEIVAAATGAGLALSRDRGATWTIERDGLHAQYCSAVAFAGDDILVAAATDHFAAQGAIYRRPIDQAGQLLPAGGGLPRWTEGIADTGNLAANGSVLAIADHGGNLHLSEDAGRSWAQRAGHLPTPSSLFIY